MTKKCYNISLTNKETLQKQEYQLEIKEETKDSIFLGALFFIVVLLCFVYYLAPEGYKGFSTVIAFMLMMNWK